MRIVVIGGFGNFGARICGRLNQELGLDIVATSRHAREADGIGNVKAAALDIDASDFATNLRQLHPDLVIHCAGPFQGQDYRVALASLASGANYIDIADGREFVAAFVAGVDPAAQAAGRFAITGASTLPALSSAVVDDLNKSFASVDAIDIVIAPGQQAPRGDATVAAVLGYAGKAFPWWQDGQWRKAHGWQELKRERFSFGGRLAAACDVPDLVLLQCRYPGAQSVTFRAALEVSVQHIALWLLAAARRIGVPLQMKCWAPGLNRVGHCLDRFGSGTGGMKVRVQGRDSAGKEVAKIWELVAVDNHGPEIPCMAAVILANKSRQGEIFQPGARVCMGILELAGFEPEFARWGISTSISESRP
jgi:hypothetical protein